MIEWEQALHGYLSQGLAPVTVWNGVCRTLSDTAAVMTVRALGHDGALHTAELTLRIYAKDADAALEVRDTACGLLDGKGTAGGFSFLGTVQEAALSYLPEPDRMEAQLRCRLLYYRKEDAN